MCLSFWQRWSLNACSNTIGTSYHTKQDERRSLGWFNVSVNHIQSVNVLQSNSQLVRPVEDVVRRVFVLFPTLVKNCAMQINGAFRHDAHLSHSFASTWAETQPCNLIFSTRARTSRTSPAHLSARNYMLEPAIGSFFQVSKLAQT